MSTGDAEGRAAARLAVWSARGAALALGLGTLLIALALLLDRGVWRTTYELPVPAARASAAGTLYVTDLAAPAGLDELLSSHGDLKRKRQRSRAQLRLGEQVLPRWHTPRGLLESNARLDYQHWEDQIWLFVPAGMRLDDLGPLQITHSWHLRPWLVQVGALAILLGLIGRRPRAGPSTQAASARLPWLALLVGSAALSALALAYLGAVLWAMLAGVAWPSTTVWQHLPGLATWMGQHLTALPYGLMVLAAAAAWGGSGSASAAHARCRLERLWVWLGLPVLLAYLLFFVSSLWVGMGHDAAINPSSLFGLIPFSDAAAHHSASFEQAANGHWGSFAERRPLAAAWRTALMHAVGFSPPHFLWLQVSLTAAALYAAFVAVLRWRGVAAGLIYLALMLVLVTPYVATLLSEPLALPLALLAVVPLLAVLRGSPVAVGTLAVAVLTLALLMRMGSMFTIPALMLWLVVVAGGARWSSLARARVLVLSVLAVLVPWTASALVAARFGSGAALASNFSHTLCGLAHGGNWTLCPERYAEPLAQLGGAGADGAAGFMYRMAWQAIVSDPATLLARLLDGALSFLLHLPAELFTGYGQDVPRYFPLLAALGLLVGAVRAGRWRGTGKREGLLWLLLGGAATASASVVHFDDGWRVLSVTMPLLGLFVAACVPNGRPGATPPTNATEMAVTPARWSALVPATVGLLVLGACLIAPSLTAPPALRTAVAASTASLPEAGERDLLGASFVAAVLVVPDSELEGRRGAVVSWSALRRMLALSGIETYQRLPLQDLEGTAFGLAAAFEPGGQVLHYVVPARLLMSPDAELWRVRLAAAAPGDIWRVVVQARALPLQRGPWEPDPARRVAQGHAGVGS